MTTHIESLRMYSDHNMSAELSPQFMQLILQEHDQLLNALKRIANLAKVSKGVEPHRYYEIYANSLDAILSGYNIKVPK
jgi:hypothetical protein